MSIHVCKCFHNGNVEYHLRYPGMSEDAAQNLADLLNAGYLKIPDNQSEYVTKTNDVYD